MNILFFIDRYPGIGGIENVSTLIIRELQKIHNVYIISQFAQEGCSVPEDIKVYQMPNSGKSKDKGNYEYYRKLLTELAIDRVIYQDSYGPSEKIVCEVAINQNIPLYVFEHNSPLFIYKKRDLDPITSPKGLLRLILHPYLLNREVKRKKYLLSNAKKYVLLSKTFVPEFCELIGADQKDERITYINNPVIPSVSTEVAKENIILCVSRLAPEKCVVKMIHIWENIADRLTDWKLQIVGDGPERARLETIVNNNNIPRVEFIGFTKPTKYYQKAKIFLLTSKYEGWGMTLVEAMQQGCVPIAYHSFSSLTDIIDNGINGYVVKNDDQTSFEAKVIELTHNQFILDEFKVSAMNKSKTFEINNILHHWLDLLK